MSALPHRHHGGDRLHREAQSLLAGSGYIMTRDRRSNCTKPNRPPDRGGDVVAPAVTGMPEQGPNAQVRAVPIARKAGCRGEWLPTPARYAPIAFQQRSLGYST